MKTQRFTHIPGMALTAMLTLLVVQVLVFGQDARAQEKTIVGTWILRGERVDCATGQPTNDTPVFNDQRTYIAGGTIIQTTETLLQTNVITFSRTPCHGIWKQETVQRYEVFHRCILYNGDNPAGHQEVTEHTTLSTDANTLTADASVEIFDVNGNLFFTSCASYAAQRLQFPK
jgi:hypothetical protein